MHLRTHVRPEHPGRYTYGDSEYNDGMIEHDETVGTLLKALDDMSIANDTIVVYTADNGPHMNTWPGRRVRWPRLVSSPRPAERTGEAIPVIDRLRPRATHLT